MVSRCFSHCQQYWSEAEDRLVSHASSSAAGMNVDIETSIADSVVPAALDTTEPHNKRPRLLARYNTEEAVAKYLGDNNE